MAAFDFEETQQPVIRGVKGLIRLRSHELLDIAEKQERLGGLLQSHVGAGGNHQAVCLLVAVGLDGAAAEGVDDLAILLFREQIAHQCGLGVRAEIFHACVAEDKLEILIREFRLAEFGGGQRGMERGLTADFRGVRGRDNFLKQGERFLQLTRFQRQMPQRDLGLRGEQTAGRIINDLFVRANGFAIPGQKAVAISR